MLPFSDDNEDLIGYGNLTSIKPENINLLSGQDITKCADSDKLQVLWKRPESPKPSNSKYVNDEVLPQELHHYESPIKLRPKNNESESPVKKQDRPQSYMDMSGENGEHNGLLSKDSDNNKLSRITSL